MNCQTITRNNQYLSITLHNTIHKRTISIDLETDFSDSNRVKNMEQNPINSTHIISTIRTYTLQQEWTSIKNKNKTVKNKHSNKTQLQKNHTSQLPLDWTRLKSCCCFNTFHPKPSLSSTSLHGASLFLLPWNPDTCWFQGHFLLKDNQCLEISTSIGLLAQLLEVDACCQCMDGGYKELSMVAYFTPEYHKDKREKRTHLWDKLVCTGGTMMTINSHPFDKDDTRFLYETNKILTGQQVEPIMKKYFHSVWKEFKDVDEDYLSETISSFFYISVGSMKINVDEGIFKEVK